MEIGLVGTYYGLLSVMRATFGALAPNLAEWANREREGCSYFAAVALDRRIAYSRDLLSQQMANSA